MADSSTPRYNLTKPQVDGSDDTWGDKLNVNFDVIDASMGFATWAGISGKPTTFPPTLPIATSDVTGLDTKQASQDAALAAEVTARTTADSAGSTRLDAVEAKNTSQDAAIAANATAIALRITDAPNDGGQYVRKNLNWALVSVPPGTIVADTAPASPAANQMWLKSDTGVLYIFYADPNSSQWIAVGASPQQVDQGYTRKTARARNRVNNPTAQVAQEFGTAGTAASGGYPADQWVLFSAGISAGSAKGSLPATPSPEGTTSCMVLVASTAKPSLAATDYLQVALPIEGLDVADVDWGTANAKPVVLRFCVCGALGTYGFALSNSGDTRSFCGSFTITTADVPQVFSFPIPGDTSGTWLTTTAVGVTIHFTYAVGSNFIGVAGWQAGSKLAPPGCSNGAAVIKNIYITDVGLFLDPETTGLPPPFIAPPFEDDLARCKRYWQKSYAYGIAVGFVTQQGAMSARFQANDAFAPAGCISLGVELRAAPTTAVYSPSTGANSKVYSNINGDLNGAASGPMGPTAIAFQANNANPGPSVGTLYAHWTASARML